MVSYFFTGDIVYTRDMKSKLRVPDYTNFDCFINKEPLPSVIFGINSKLFEL